MPIANTRPYFENLCRHAIPHCPPEFSYGSAIRASDLTRGLRVRDRAARQLGAANRPGCGPRSGRRVRMFAGIGRSRFPD
jgi:hypothetical protein